MKSSVDVNSISNICDICDRWQLGAIYGCLQAAPRPVIGIESKHNKTFIKALKI